MAGLQLNSRETYNTSGEIFENLITAELRALNAKFADPLNLSFKIMPDFSKPYGLISDEKNVNSALAYLKRIGENERYEMLKKWIEIFKIFVKQFDFLILSCEGIEDIINKKTGDMFNIDTDKINLGLRETSDMLCQSLITTYRHIWYDNIRQVEVLPANLKRFDLAILIYSGNYYNMALYDLVDNDNPSQSKIFPTIKKLSDKYFQDNSDTYDFNHHLITIGDAQINNEESGKTFFSSISNEPGTEFIKNNLTLNFRFAYYKGIFNNIFGEFDFVKVLALAAAQDNVSNQLTQAELNKEMSIGGNNTQPYQDTINKVKSNFKNYFADTSKTFNQIGNEELTKLKGKPASYLNRFIGTNTVIGNALTTITSGATLPTMLANTFDFGLQMAEDKLNSGMAKVNNMILAGYSDNFINAYESYFGDKKASGNVVYEKSIKSMDSESINKNNSIKVEKINIYNRNGF